MNFIFALSILLVGSISVATELTATTFIELAKKVNPAVVNISTKRQPRQDMARPRARDPFFDLFEQFMGENYQNRPAPFQALGTGFLIRKDGLIITNSHVIKGADVVQVNLMNSKTVYEAEVIGQDERTDVALIKISGEKPFPTVPLGTSKSVQVGQWVAAFGNPFGHSNSMTKGIISALGRELDEINKFPFLQTDASINQGNSGGPLVNIAGEVIGVNTAIDARAQGIGFAIPIDDVKSILEQLEEKGYVERGFIGVQMSNIDGRMARSLGLDSTDGVLVMDVVPGAPADKAGIESYDVITKFGNNKISNTSDLFKIVGDTKVGAKRKITLFRDGKKTTRTLTVGSRQTENRPTLRKKQRMGQNVPHELGFKVSALTTQMQKAYSLDKKYLKRPIVMSIDESGPAARAGLQIGDIVVDINRSEVKTVKELMRKIKSGTNMLKVVRGDRTQLVIIEK